jgi:TrmH family RNA methyltransferase
MKIIRARDNPAFRRWKKLAESGRERRKAGRTLIEGVHLIEAWQLRYGLPQTVLLADSRRTHPEIATWLTRHPDAEVVCLADALFAELADAQTPAGMLAVVEPPAAAPADVQADAVLLDGIQDPGNLGTLLRTAAAAGFLQVLLSPDCAAAWSPKVLRAGQGAHFLLRIHEACDLPGFLAAYRGTALATSLVGAQSLYDLDLDWRAPLAWIFGSEGQGVRPATLAGADLRIRIPMPGAVESLNVGAAAAVCLFETVRRRSSLI